MKSIKHYLLGCLGLFLVLTGHAQPAFVCDGTPYVIKKGKIYTLHFSFETAEAKLTPLPGSLNFDQVGAIGYNRRDNYIYALGESGPHTVFLRIDANGNGYPLDTLNLEHWEQALGAGTVSNDGKLFLFFMTNKQEIGPNVPSSALGKIRLDDPELPFEIVPLRSQIGEFPLLFADMAYHPFTDSLFAYSHFPSRRHRMIYIVEEYPRFDDTTFPIQNVSRLIMPNLFFDAFARLWGTGANLMYKPNTENGLITEKLFPFYFDAEDGCSCPFTVALQNTIAQDTLLPCTEVELTLKISNLTEKIQTNVRLVDQFPAGFEILDVLSNPFGGTVEGIGTNQLSIDNIDLPIGVDSIQIKIHIPQNASGLYWNQPRLENLDLTAGNNPANMVLSDYPTTVEPLDATPIYVRPLEISLADSEIELCQDSLLVLNPISFGNNFQYRWSDASQNPTLTVTEPGIYKVTVSTDCVQDSTTFHVKRSDLSATILTQEEVFWGETVLIDALVNSSTNIKKYSWEVNDTSTFLSTSTLTIAPQTHTNVKLRVFNESNCEAFDQVNIRVRTKIFTPTAFSPDSDGVNDWFYIQTAAPVPIKTMKVFTRWGELVFEKNNFFTNQETDGWDGFYRNQLMQASSYVWTAELDFGPLGLEFLKGDVLIIK
ncbi:MAG: gliding motility-associated C-terminal domain-containing protein [Bacteroidota bacterium]